MYIACIYCGSQITSGGGWKVLKNYISFPYIRAFIKVFPSNGFIGMHLLCSVHLEGFDSILRQLNVIKIICIAKTFNY